MKRIIRGSAFLEAELREWIEREKKEVEWFSAQYSSEHPGVLRHVEIVRVLEKALNDLPTVEVEE